ncbi:MAG: SDR family oxidoreductase [Pseudomonadota bacterium]
MIQVPARHGQLYGKNVLITGATSGIGEQLAHRFAMLGANLILVARSRAKLESIAATLKSSYGTTSHLIGADLSRNDEVESIYTQTLAKGLAVDILVNNAGQGRFGEFSASDAALYDNMIQLNVTALTKLCGLFLPQMKARNAGGIINIASNIALMPGPYMAVYSASKSYVLKLSESLAGEMIGTQVVICCACPGRTKTGFGEGAGAGADFYDDKPHDTAERVAQDIVDAFMKKRVFVITGPQKFMMAQMPRLLSRWRLIAMMSSVSRKLYR